MEKTVQKIPFLRPTIALAVGIYFGYKLNISIPILLFFSLFFLATLILIHRFYKYYLESWFGIALQFLFILLGILTFEIYNLKPVFQKQGIYVATVMEKPQEKQNSYKSILKISAIKTMDSVIITNLKTLVYFEKNDRAKNLEPGEKVALKNTPQIVKNYGNPFEFNYKNYLAHKKIYHQVYLSSDSWEIIELPKDPSIKIFAEQIREKLITVYRNQRLGANELEILSALTLGYKRGLDPETKRVFSAAGAMHVLAVSGLHVGIIFWSFSLLFGFLKKTKIGKLFFVLFSIFLLWTYAFITGLSPSVMRASTMFTIFVIGDNLNRRSNTYNSLAASALLLLLINPNNLFEVGFQLSYSAVFGIVFLQPKLSTFISINNKILRFFWSLLTVSIAAQISTFPLTIFYFNQFPSYFWITNLIVIPAVMILIPMGMMLLLFSNIPIISGFISFFLQSLIKCIYGILQYIEQLPHSTYEISIRPTELILLLGILLSGFLLLHSFKASYIKVTLLFLLAFFTTSLVFKINQLNNREIIVYNTPQNLTAQLICGKENIIISESKIEENDNIQNIIRNTNRKLRLNSPLFLSQKDSASNNFFYYKNGLILFDKRVFLFNPEISNLPEVLSPNLLIINESNYLSEELISTNTRIITNKRYYQPKTTDIKRFHNTSSQGAFIENW
ncbi:ComEC family competence protein [Draconibacterium sp.]|nr:ComEC family competence protein [Draconibacterium sp.]